MPTVGSLGQAWVSISPDLAQFGSESKTGIDAALRTQRPRVTVGADTKEAIADVAALKKAIESQPASVQINTGVAAAKLTSLDLQADALKARLANITPNIRDAGALASIVAIEAALDAVKAKGSAIGIGDLASTDAAAQVNALSRQFATLRNSANTAVTAMEAVANETDDLGNHVTRVGIVSGNWFSTLTRAGSSQIPIFAGALGSMIPALENSDNSFVKLTGHMVNAASGWHLMSEAIIETVAIWAPAAIAVTAFGLAAAPSVKALSVQLDNMNTAAKGTGQTFAVLATRGESVTAAVKPEVMEAFGIALHTLTSNSGNLGGVLHGLGQDFLQLEARASIAFASKSGGTFMAGASKDAQALTTSFVELGSILGTVLKAVPGYAEILLGFGNDVLGVSAKVTSAVEPILAVFLKLHGAILYGGLFGTLAAKGFSAIVSGAANAAGGLANLAGKFEILGGESGKLATGAADAATALDDMAAGPVIAGIGLIVGAFAAVYLGLKASKTAAQQFNATIQQTIQNSSLLALSATITSGLAQTATDYSVAAKGVAAAQVKMNAAVAGGTTDVRGQAYQLRAAQDNAGTYAAGISQLTTQQKNFQANLAEVAGALGLSGSASSKNAQALAILEGAQVSANQATASGASNTATLNVMAHGYETTLQALTAGTGTLGQALNALNVTQSAQITDVQKITQAYSTWIGIVTGGDSQFATFEQGQSTLNDELKAGSAAGVKLTTTSGKLKESQTLLGTALLGTSTSALAARQAFDSQIQAGSTLLGSLMTMAAASGSTASAQNALAKSGKDVIAQLLPMAKGSAQATAEVFALAQMAGFNGVDSFQALSKWAGNVKGSESDLNQQQAILTLSTANLTQAAKNLSATLGQAVTAAQTAAIAKTVNLQQVTNDLTASVVNSNGKLTTTTITLAGVYYEALIRAGEGSVTATQQTDAFLRKLGETPAQVATVNAAIAKLPKNVSIAFHESLSGSGQIKAAITAQSLTLSSSGAATQAANLIGVAAPGKARGGILSGAGPSGQDGPIFRGAPGELVIPTSHAAKYGAMAKRDGIPGFAAGGTIGGVLSNVSQGEAATANGMAAMTSAAMKAFVALLKPALAAAGGAFTGSVPGGSANLLVIAKYLLANGFNAGAAAGIAATIDGESGGNPESVGSGGFGLIGWSGNTIGLPPGYHGPTGNVQADMSAQLRGVIGYINANGGRGPLNAAGNPVLAGDIFSSRYERPLVSLSDTRPGLANQLYAELLSSPAAASKAIQTQANVSGKLNQVKPHSGGGVISEPVLGYGVNSGTAYSFAENGQPEFVSNQSQSAAAAPNTDQLLRIALQNIGGQLAVIARQNSNLPNVLGHAISSSGRSGVQKGYFSSQN